MNKDELVGLIRRELNQYLKDLELNQDRITQKTEVNYILVYMNVLVCSAHEIIFLYTNGWNNSIESMVRDLLECYVVVTYLIDKFGTKDDFEKYLQSLLFTDLKQTLSIIKEIQINYKVTRDSSYLKEKEIELDKGIRIISEKFPSFMENIEQIRDKYEWLENKKNEIKNEYSFSGGNKAKQIKIALSRNCVLTQYYGHEYVDGAVIYRYLCHSTHNNFSAVSKSTVSKNPEGNKQLTWNIEPDGMQVYLELLYCCLKDVRKRIVLIVS